MQRASNAFSVLQALSITLVLAVIFWSVGMPTLRFAEAANVTSFSDTLSNSAPSVVSNHTIQFTTPTGVGAGETIVITFPAGFTGIGSLTEDDVDLDNEGTEEDLGAAAAGTTWGVNASGQTVTITSGSDTIASNATVTIEIGTNATAGASGSNQITNPTAGSYQIGVTAGSADSGFTRVAIVDSVTVTASVDTLFTFTVAGVAGGQTVNGTTTGASTTATEINFGALDVNTASTAAQDLSVTTNARNGFVVTVQSDGQLTSSSGADIDGFRNGNYDTTPVAWESPANTVGSEETYGHWGLTSDDDDYFAVSETYVSASTTPVEVFAHAGPADGTVTGQGTTRIGYTVEIGSLQEAAEDYQATLTYVATPVF